MQWYRLAFKKYADFSGRARRKEYWMFVLFHALAILILYVVAIAGIVTLVVNLREPSPLSALPVIPLVVYALATIVPTLALIVRRLHDTGRSGGWYFIAFVPFVGAIILLVFMFEDSQQTPNQYGECPKPVTAFYPFPPQYQPYAHPYTQPYTQPGPPQP
ncbi:DUF805 domain-containing protein [Glycomyces sp. NPDC046736]|uniref:DUF805 domain-containing protein n=1 Tax=Glycomyces sp. NPDC046736 TaxID=3155615 RepID=UPI0033D24288